MMYQEASTLLNSYRVFTWDDTTDLIDARGQNNTCYPRASIRSEDGFNNPQPPFIKGDYWALGWVATWVELVETSIETKRTSLWLRVRPPYQMERPRKVR